MPGLREDILILLSSATFILLQYVVDYMLEDLKTIWHRVDTQLRLSENHEYSSVLHPTWTRVSLWQLQVGPATTSMNFSHFVPLNTLFHWYLLPMRDFRSSLENTGSLCLHRTVEPFHYMVSKPHICKYPHHLIGRVFLLQEAVKPVMAYTSVLEFPFLFASLNLFFGTKYCQLFFLKCQAHCIHFWEHVFCIPKANPS